MPWPLRHRQTKGAANTQARPTATAPHPDSTAIRPEPCPPCHRKGVRHGSGILSVMGRITHPTEQSEHPFLHWRPMPETMRESR